MESLAYLIVYFVIGYLPLSIAAYNLMSLADYRRRWRAWIPLWNLFMLSDLAERSRFFLLLLFVPLVNFLVLPMISGNLADLTGRPKWVGWIAGFQGVHIIGLPILALTATSENNLPREYLPDAETVASVYGSTARTDGEFRYRYTGAEEAATPLASTQSESQPGSTVPEPGVARSQTRSESEERALARIKTFLDEGHSPDAIRNAGWSEWIDYLESRGYDLQTGRLRLEPPDTAPTK